MSAPRQEAVLRAREILGGIDEVAARLKISKLALLAMASGRIEVPQRVFFELIDIISMQSAPDRTRPPPKRSDPGEQPGE